MQGYQNNEQIYTENTAMALAALTVLGDRQEQQDSFGFEMKENQGLAVICDGMGGMESGGQASRLTVELLLSRYIHAKADCEPVQLLQDCATEANERVRNIRDKDGNCGTSGTTMVAALVQNRALHWLSIGDSRGYLCREGEFLQFTLDQNYGTVLEEQKQAGKITREEYCQKSERAEALVSYIGIKKLGFIDYSRQPLPLQSGDKILLMSDGLYKLLEDESLRGIVDNFTNIQEALQVLEMQAQKSADKSGMARDNMTVILIKIK